MRPTRRTTAVVLSATAVAALAGCAGAAADDDTVADQGDGTSHRGADRLVRH